MSRKRHYLQIVPKTENEEVSLEPGPSSATDQFKPRSNRRLPKNTPASLNMYESCHVCGRVTNNKSNYDIHMRIHTREMPYVCQTCGKGFAQSNNMYRHCRAVHGVEPKSER